MFGFDAHISIFKGSVKKWLCYILQWDICWTPHTDEAILDWSCVPEMTHMQRLLVRFDTMIGNSRIQKHAGNLETLQYETVYLQFNECWKLQESVFM